jgi:hypothetical protein
MQKKLLLALACLLVMASGQQAMAQVTSITGDGTLITNSGSTGDVDLTLGNAGAYTLWGNNTSSSATPGYQTSPQISGTMTAGAVNLPTGATGYEINSVPIILSGGQLQRGGSTTLSYCPYKGNMKTTASQGIYTIPSGCLTATITSMYKGGTASQSLSAGTLYYIYLWNNSGTWVLDAETTGHATNTTTGVEQESGDSTKTLIGMAYPQSGPVLTDSTSARLLASWDNRQPKNAYNSFSVTRSTTSTSWVEINTEIRTAFLTWGDTYQASYTGTGWNLTANDEWLVAIYVDGSSMASIPSIGFNNSIASGRTNTSVPGAASSSEGYHYITIFGEVNLGTGEYVAGDTLSWTGSI